jgi:hypothetical protein
MRPIRAEIDKSNRCDAAGYMVTGYSPVLAMCRKLVEAGFDPATPLHAYRGDTLCLKVRSIGEGAKWTVRDSRFGTPSLRSYRGPREGVVLGPHVDLAA